MKSSRWRVGTLMGLVLVAGLGLKGVLLVQSRHRNVSGRRFALARLIARPRPAATESILVDALDDPELRHTATWALDRIGSTSPALVRVLLENLWAETEHSRRSRWDHWHVNPAEALKRIKLPAAVLIRQLRPAMASKDRWIRFQATDVLCDTTGRPGPPAPTLALLLMVALQDKEAAIRMRAAEALARPDQGTRQRAVAVLLEQLRGPELPAKLLAAISLARFDPEGEAAVAIVADRPRGGDLATRPSDLYLLGYLGPMARPAVPAVVRAMTSPDAGQHFPYFLSGLRTGRDSWHPWDLDKIVDSVERAAWSSNLCSLGAAVLERIGPEAEQQAVAILVGMLQGEDEAQRLRAADALGALGPKASASIPAMLALAEQTTTARSGNDDAPALIRCLRNLEKVGKGDDPEFVAALVQMLRSSDGTKRWGAATTLSQLDPPAPTAAPWLIGALKDRTQSVRHSAALALGRYKGPVADAAVPALLDALQDEDEWVRCQVAKALACHRAGADRAVPTVILLLESENPSLRRVAAETLGAFGPAAGLAVPALLEARTDAEEYVRDEVEKALKAVAPSEIEIPRD